MSQSIASRIMRPQSSTQELMTITIGMQIHTRAIASSCRPTLSANSSERRLCACLRVERGQNHSVDIERILTCDICNGEPAHVCYFQSVQGRFFFSDRNEYAGHLCSSCLISTYGQHTRKTLLAGWWSLHGFVHAPAAIATNTCELLSCLRKLRRTSKGMQKTSKRNVSK